MSAAARPSGALERAAGWWQVFVLCASAPGFAAGIAFNVIFVVAFAAAGMPFMFIVASLVILTVANTFAEFSKRIPAAGSAFTYCSVGLGRTAGFLVGWLFAGVYLTTVVGGSVLMGGWLEAFSKEHLGATIPWWLFTLVLAAAALYSSTLGLKRVMSLTFGLLAFEVVALLALAVTILVRGGPDGFSLEPLSPSSLSGIAFSTAALGFVYAVLSFAGFEEGATLAEETRGREPTPRGIITGALITSVLFIFVAFAMSIGAGTSAKNVAKFAADTSALQTLTSDFWGSGAVWIIVLAVGASTWAFYIAALNAAARVLFAMGREGVLPASFAQVSARHRTPANAVIATSVLSLAIALPTGALVHGGPLASWGYIGFILALGFLAIYALVSIALVVFMLRQHRSEFNVVRHLLLPAVSIVAPLYVLERLFDPGPGAPYTYFPFGIVAFVLVGVVVLVRLRRTAPERWHQVGHVLAGEEITDDYDAQRAAPAG